MDSSTVNRCPARKVFAEGLSRNTYSWTVPGLGLDMVWNPRLADDGFITWLRGLLHEAAGSAHDTRA